MKIYVVIRDDGDDGEYSERVYNLIRAYRTEAEAQAWITRADERLRELRAKLPPNRYDPISHKDGVWWVRSLQLAKDNEIDPGASLLDSTYRYETVELEES